MSGNRINAHKRIDLVQKLLVVFTVVTFLFSATLWVSSKYRGYEFRVFPFSFPMPYEFFRWFNDLKKIHLLMQEIQSGSLGRPPGGGNDNPLQYYCLENSMDRRTWQATVWTHQEFYTAEHASMRAVFKLDFVAWQNSDVKQFFLFSQRSNHFTRRYLP